MRACVLQQLAALLIARQVIGNLKESALPYLLEQMRLAKLSFDLWGALSPTGSRAPPGMPPEKRQDSEEEQPPLPTDRPDSEANVKRTISQAELESSLYRVIVACPHSCLCTQPPVARSHSIYRLPLPVVYDVDTG